MLNKVLLVGGTGYVGKTLGSFLLNAGYELFITGTNPPKGDHFFQINFETPDTFANLKGQKFDLIIILAARLNSLFQKDLNHPDLVINTMGYASFLQFVKDQNLGKKIIYTSSMTVYSSENKSPVVESGIIGPCSTYGLSKYLGEGITSFFCYNNDFKGVIFRLPGIYGGEKKSGFIYNTTNNLKSDQPVNISTKNLIFWETIHVDDLCEMIMHFIGVYKWNKDIDIYNICYGTETDLYDTFNFIRTELGMHEQSISESEKGYVKLYLSNKKLKEMIPVTEDYYGRLREYISTV